MIQLITLFLFSNSMLLETVSIHRQSFEPEVAVNGAYQKQEDGSKISARFKWNTKRPTLNLDNFDQIKQVDCREDLVHIKFDTPENAKAAHNAWKDVRNLAVMLGHEHQCKGIGNVSTLAVERVMEPNEIELIIDTLVLEYDQLFDGFDLFINRRPFSETGRSRFRDFAKIHKFDLNYDRTNQSVIKEDKKLLQLAAGIDSVSGYNEIHCFNCYMTGNLNVSMHMQYRRGHIEAYQVWVNGEIKANIDLDVFALATTAKSLVHFNIASLGFTPFIVPGIFSMGPSIRLDVGMEIRVLQSVGVNFGYDYHHKFDFFAQGTNFSSKPKTIYTGKPVVNAHKVELDTQLELLATAYILPYLSFGAEILRDKVSLNLGLGNSISAKVSAGGGHDCPKGRFNLALVQSHDVEFWIESLDHYYWFGIKSSPENNLICSFCNMCF